MPQIEHLVKTLCDAKTQAYKNKYDFIFCLFWYAQQQNPYSL
jgi:hypothetical protein